MNPTFYGFELTVYDWDELRHVDNEITCRDCGEEIGSCECGAEESEMIAEDRIFAGVAYYNARYGGHA